MYTKISLYNGADNNIFRRNIRLSFYDNIERARRSGVTAIVQPGGSIRDAQVIDTCNKYGIAMAFCGIRLFHH